MALLAGLEERGGVLWSVDVDPASAAVFSGHDQWRFVLADSREERPGYRTNWTSCSSTPSTRMSRCGTNLRYGETESFRAG